MLTRTHTWIINNCSSNVIRYIRLILIDGREAMRTARTLQCFYTIEIQFTCNNNSLSKLVIESSFFAAEHFRRTWRWLLYNRVTRGQRSSPVTDCSFTTHSTTERTLLRVYSWYNEVLWGARNNSSLYSNLPYRGRSWRIESLINDCPLRRDI